jgi:hypothetical protein
MSNISVLVAIGVGGEGFREVIGVARGGKGGQGRVSPHTRRSHRDLSEEKNKGRDMKITYIPQINFKDLVLHGTERGEPVAYFVMTGEFTPYANVILVSGVPF